MDDHHQRYNNPSFLFLTKGSQVEVTSGEDGIPGAWYVATVIHPPPVISSANHRTGNNLVYVEYHNLLSEDGSSLREYANISYVRPSPVTDTNPPNFRLNDLVDAFYRDGWWTGVITTVIDDTNFVVTFQSPADQIQFHCSDLRIHRDWVGGRWFQPQKQFFYPCSQNSRNETNRNDVHSRQEVEFQQPPGYGDKAILFKVTVDYSHIRPSPPHLRDKNFVLLEKVDAYYNFGWWSGVITKELADNRYNVFFKHTKKVREFIYSSLRPHMEWKGGKWFNASQGDTDGRTTHSLIDEQLEQTTPNIDKQSTVTTSISKETNQENLDGIDTGSPLSKKLQDEIINDYLSQQTNCVLFSPVSVSEKVGSGVDAASVAPKRKRGRPPKSLALRPNTPVTFSVVEGGQKKEVGLTTSLATKSLEENQGPEREQSAKQNAPLSNDKLPNEKYSAKKVKQRTISINNESPAQVFVVDSQAAFKEKPDGSLEKDLATRNPEASVGKSPDTVSNDQLLSRWFEDLPFVRNTSLWKTIESMEAFRKLPQKPHFCPLLKGVKESAREGLAIGTMVTFSTIVDKTCGLRFNDPRSTIEDCLDTLVELENNGFDVEVIRDRLTQLLLLKDKQDELAKRSKGVVEKIEEDNVRGTRNDEEIEAIDREMRELEEKRKHVLLKKEKWSLEFGVMEAMFGEIEQETRGVGAEFDGLAAAPLLSI